MEMLRVAPRFASLARGTASLRGWHAQRAAASTDAGQDALKRLLHERRAVKAFASDPVPDETLAEILRLTQVLTSLCVRVLVGGGADL